MSIQSESRKAGPYLGNGTNTLFTFDFKIFKADELLVVYTDPDGIERTLALNTDYTVSLNADQDSAPGGNIRTTVAPPAGYRITMTSDVPNLQQIVLTNSGGFYPVLLNEALDRVTILVQQNTEEISRAVKVTLSTDKTPDELLASIYDSAHQANLAEADAKAAAESAQGVARDITTWARNQTKTMGGATPGSAPNFVVTNADPYTAILDGTRINVFFAENGITGSNTLSIDGLSGPLVQMGLDGVEAPAVIVAGMFADIVATSYRGNIKYHVINPIRPQGSRLLVTSTGTVQIPFAWRGQMLRVTLIGGGGGGGAGAAGANAIGGGGGGGGGAGELVVSQVSMPANQASLYAVIGSGGAGAAAGASNGASGGATVLYSQLGGATLASAAGGGGATSAGGDASVPKSYPGIGGSGGGIGGGTGSYAPGYSYGIPGNGGSGAASGFGRGGDSGGRSGVDNVPGGGGGSAQANTGAGGGGGGGGLGDPTPSSGGAGGNGGSGLIIIELLQ